MKRTSSLLRAAGLLLALSALLTGCGTTVILPHPDVFPPDPVPNPIVPKKPLPGPDERPTPIPMPQEGTFPAR